MKAARHFERHGRRHSTLVFVTYRHSLRVSELVALSWDHVTRLFIPTEGKWMWCRISCFFFSFVVVFAASTGCQQPLPNRVYRASAVMRDGRWVAMSTESEAIKDSWRIQALNPNIEIAGRKIAIEPKRVVVNSGEIATLPPGTQKVEVAERQGTLHILADGTAIEKF